MASPTVLIIPSFIHFNTVIPIATLLVAMPTLLITSWQSHFFQFSVSSVCVFFLLFFLKSSFICSNLDNSSQTEDMPTVVTENNPECRWFLHSYSLSICPVYSLTYGTSGFYSYSSFALRTFANDTVYPLWITAWLVGSFTALQPCFTIGRAGVCNYLSSVKPNVPTFVRQAAKAKRAMFMWWNGKGCVLFDYNSHFCQ